MGLNWSKGFNPTKWNKDQWTTQGVNTLATGGIGGNLEASALGASGIDAPQNAKEYQAFALGGPMGLKKYRDLLKQRDDVNAPKPIDPILQQNALQLQLTPDNPLMVEARKRYVSTLRGAGRSDAAAQALAARRTTGGFLDLMDTSNAYMGGLQALSEETKRQRESIGKTPDPLTAQWQGFWSNL